MNTDVNADGQQTESTENPIQMTPKQLKERLDRAVQSKINELKSKGLVIDETELESKRQIELEEKQRTETELKEKGKYKSLYEQSLEQLKQLKESNEKLQNDYIQRDLDIELTNSLSKLELLPELFDDAKTVLKQKIRFDKERKVVDEKGNPLVDDSYQPVTVDNYVSKWIKDKPFWLKPTIKSGTGGSAPTTGAGASLPANWQTDDVYRTLSPEQKKLALELATKK